MGCFGWPDGTEKGLLWATREDLRRQLQRRTKEKGWNLRVASENRARKLSGKRGGRKTRIERKKERESGGDLRFWTEGLLVGRKTKKMGIFQGLLGKDFGELE